MKKLILMSLFLAVVIGLKAQTKPASAAEVKQFLGSTTNVVLEENPFSVFNASITANMDVYWKITPYKIISPQEFEKIKTDPKKSFLYISWAEITKTKTSLFKANTGLFDNVDQFRYNLLNLVLGEKSGNLNKMPDLASLPLSYVAPVSKNEEDDEGEEIDYAYKLGGVLRLMQFYIHWTVDNPNKSFDNLMDAYTSELKTVELWLTKDDLAEEASTAEKIAKAYPYKIKMVTTAEIENAIKEGNQNAVFVHKIGPEKFKLKDPICFITLVNCATGKPYYFGYHKVKDHAMDGITLSDFKKMAK
jgi:hypothetical protein